MCAFVADIGGGDIARAVLNIEENGKRAKEVGELTGTSEVPSVGLGYLRAAESARRCSWLDLRLPARASA